MKLIVLTLAMAVAVFAHHDESPHTASVFLTGNGVQGTIKFSDEDDGSVRVRGHISGMAPGDYGFHVHEKGDVSGGCGTTGSHFNPEHKQHGHPSDTNRHVGDLGNIHFNDQGVAEFDFKDSFLSLKGPHNIIGRAVVLHEREDDFGKSEHPDSKTTGNAGGRVACGVIGILSPVYGTNAASSFLNMTPTVFVAFISFLFLIK